MPLQAAAKKQDRADAAMTRQLASIRAILAGKHAAPRASAAMQVSTSRMVLRLVTCVADACAKRPRT
jgi:hypothetical protein